MLDGFDKRMKPMVSAITMITLDILEETGQYFVGCHSFTQMPDEQLNSDSRKPSKATRDDRQQLEIRWSQLRSFLQHHRQIDASEGRAMMHLLLSIHGASHGGSQY